MNQKTKKTQMKELQPAIPLSLQIPSLPEHQCWKNIIGKYEIKYKSFDVVPIKTEDRRAFRALGLSCKVFYEIFLGLEISSLLSRSLTLSTFNGDKLDIEKIIKPNIYMGIGMWSFIKNDLSLALPVDVMQMLMPATILRTLISERTHKNSELIILIADSMAVAEGASHTEVNRLTKQYIASLKEMLVLLNMWQYTHYPFI